MALIDPKIRQILQFIGKNAEKIPFGLYPVPTWTIDATTLLDEIVRVYELDKCDVGLVVEDAAKPLPELPGVFIP